MKEGLRLKIIMNQSQKQILQSVVYTDKKKKKLFIEEFADLDFCSAVLSHEMFTSFPATLEIL